MRQTAVKWLELKLLGVISFDSEELRAEYKEIIQQAKEMDSLDIILAYKKGCRDTLKDEIKQGMDYYLETFKNE